MNPKIYILLPVHNRIAVTECFIDCLAAQSYSNYHLILVDDGSDDGTAGMVRDKIDDLTVLKGRGNWWWAGSLQQGINCLKRLSVADRDIVLFANDDITFDTDFLQKAVGLLDELDDVLLLPFLRDTNTGLLQETGIDANLRKHTFDPASSPDRINCLSTRGLFMRMIDLTRIGGFHPRLLPHYLSDYEFTIRAHRKGLKLCTSNELVISLDHDQTGYHSFEQKGFVAFIRQYFSKRSAPNPVYHTSFVLLTGSWSSIPFSLIVVWRRAIANVIHQVRRSLRMLI